MSQIDRPLFHDLLSLLFRIYHTSHVKEWIVESNNDGGRSYIFACTFKERFPVRFSHMREIVALDKHHVRDIWYEGDLETTTIAGEIFSRNFPVDMSHVSLDLDEEAANAGSKRKKQHS